MSDKIYCGNAKVIKTQYGGMMKLSFTEDDLKTMVANLDKGWVNVSVNKRKEASKGGMTHYCQIDTWKPEKPVEAKEIDITDDMPF